MKRLLSPLIIRSGLYTVVGRSRLFNDLMLHGHELWNRGELPHTSNTLEIYKNHVFRTGQFCFFKTYEWCRTSAGVCSTDGAGVVQKKSTQNHGNNIILLDCIHFTIHSAIVPCPPPLSNNDIAVTPKTIHGRMHIFLSDCARCQTGDSRQLGEVNTDFL